MGHRDVPHTVFLQNNNKQLVSGGGSAGLRELAGRFKL